MDMSDARYEILSKDTVGTWMLLGGLVGLVFTIMIVLKWFGLVEIINSPSLTNQGLLIKHISGQKVCGAMTPMETLGVDYVHG